MKKLKNQLRDIFYMIKAFIFRNSMILINDEVHTVQNDVNLHWWRLSSEKQNIGDMLSPVVVDYLVSINNLKRIAPKNTHLYAIGSIIDGGYQNATIWGSGVLRGNRLFWWRFFRKLDIRCVRGPETRKLLLKNGYNCPAVYGDPAILMPLIYPKELNERKYPYLVIEHMNYESDLTYYEYNLSPLTREWKAFIDELVKAKLVISSSLHGIILAEAYGIPAIFLNKHNMNLFKYYDYYYSTGREDFPIAKSVEEALTMKASDLPRLEKMQKDLIDSFPVDLWKMK